MFSLYHKYPSLSEGLGYTDLDALSAYAPTMPSNLMPIPELGRGVVLYLNLCTKKKVAVDFILGLKKKR